MTAFPPARASAWWVYAFLLFQFACQSAPVKPNDRPPPARSKAQPITSSRPAFAFASAEVRALSGTAPTTSGVTPFGAKCRL